MDSDLDIKGKNRKNNAEGLPHFLTCIVFESIDYEHLNGVFEAKSFIGLSYPQIKVHKLITCF